MQDQYSRTQLLLGKEAMEKLHNSRVAVFGIGGVGGYTVEALARSGVGALDLIDDDKVCLTNLNRQIVATRKTVGQYKVDVAEQRIHEIDPNIKVTTYKIFFTPETQDQFDFTQYDYVVDAIDTVTGKIALVVKAKEAGTPIICTGGLLLGALLGLVFWLTIQGANVPSALLQRGFDAVEGVLWAVADSFHAPSWLSGALIAGVYQTTAKVVSVMLPPVLIFFPLFTLLEDSGYLPRVAFLLDAGFERCGSCGKQALTMCMGFGCNAAGVSGCRIIDSEREKRIGMLTNALVPCNGRFPTLLTLSALFFGGTACSAALVLTGCVLLGAAMTMAASFVLGKTILRGAPSHFTLELPPFRMPNVGRVLVRSVMDRSLFVLGRAAAVAAPAGLLLWLLGNVQIGGETILTFVARALEPVGAWLGIDGAILLAFALSFPANELLLPVWVMIVSSGATLAQAQTADVGGLLLSSGWTMKTALCVMVFTLFHFPCSTTVLTIRKETGSTRWALLGMLLPAAIGVLFCRLLNLLL